MTDLLTERLTRAAAQAMRGVELHHPRGAVPPEGGASSQRRRGARRWLTVSASLLAASMVGLVFWATGQTGSNAEPTGSSPESPPLTEPRTARAAALAAVAATLDAPAWSTEVTGGVEETYWVYESPDRIEMKTAGSDGEWVSRSVTVGTDMWVHDDGGWTLQQQDWRTAAAFNLLDGLRRIECVAWDGETVVYWFRPAGDCGAAPGQLPDDLPVTSEVGAIELDEAGRIRSIRAAEVLEVDGQRVIRPDPDAADLLGRVGAAGGVIATFRYEDVPPVTVPDVG